MSVSTSNPLRPRLSLEPQVQTPVQSQPPVTRPAANGAVDGKEDPKPKQLGSSPEVATSFQSGLRPTVAGAKSAGRVSQALDEWFEEMLMLMARVQSEQKIVTDLQGGKPYWAASVEIARMNQGLGVSLGRLEYARCKVQELSKSNQTPRIQTQLDEAVKVIASAHVTYKNTVKF